MLYALCTMRYASELILGPRLVPGADSPFFALLGSAPQELNNIRPAFDSKWVPPVGGAPSRHTGTGGAADGVHGQYLSDSGAGDRSRVVPRSKQLGKQPDEAMSSRASS
jgi:hypothetical protein